MRTPPTTSSASGIGLWQRRSPPIAHPWASGTDPPRTSLALAEWIAARMIGPSGASVWTLQCLGDMHLRRVLKSYADYTIASERILVGQGCAGFSPAFSETGLSGHAPSGADFTTATPWLSFGTHQVGVNRHAAGEIAGRLSPIAAIYDNEGASRKPSSAVVAMDWNDRYRLHWCHLNLPPD